MHRYSKNRNLVKYPAVLDRMSALECRDEPVSTKRPDPGEFLRTAIGPVVPVPGSTSGIPSQYPQQLSVIPPIPAVEEEISPVSAQTLQTP